MIYIFRIYLFFALAFISSFSFALTEPDTNATCPAGYETSVCSIQNKNCGTYAKNYGTKYIPPGIKHASWGYLCGKVLACPVGYELVAGQGYCKPKACTPPKIQNIVINAGVRTASCIDPPIEQPALCPSGKPKFNGQCQVCFEYNADGSCLSPNQCPSGEVNQGTLNGQAICKKTCADSSQSYGVFNGVEGCYGTPTCPNSSDSFGSVNGVYGCYGSHGANNGGNVSSSPSSSGTSTSSGGSNSTNPNSVGATYPETEACPSGFTKEGSYCVKPQGDCLAGYHSVVVSRTPFYAMCVVNQQPSSSSASSAPSSIPSNSISSVVASTGTSTSSGSGSSVAASSGGASSSGTANAGNCNSQPSCSGDAIQCAILQQSWLNNCEGLEKAVPINADSDNATIKSEFDDLINNNKTDLEADGTIKGITTEADLSKVTDEIFDMAAIADSSGSGVCPAPRVLNMSLGSFELSYQPFCDLAIGISNFVILISSLLASLMIFRTIQGT